MYDSAFFIINRLIIIAYQLLLADITVNFANVAGSSNQISTLSITPPWTTVYRYVNEKYVITCKAELPKIYSTDFVQQKWHYNRNMSVESLDDVRLMTISQYSVSLIFTNISERHEGTYSCSVKDGPLPFYRSFQLIIMEPIVIDCDTTVEAVIGTDVKLSCNITGKPQPYVVLEFNGKRLSPDHDTDNHGKYVWKLSNIRIEDSGNYVCSAQQSPLQRSDKRKIIKVIVYHKPVFKEKDRLIHVPLNETTILRYHVTANPPAWFIWYKDDNVQPIKPKFNRIGIANDNKTTSLKVTFYNQTYFGSYKCEACNELGCVSRNITVNETIKLLQPKIGLWHIDTDLVRFYVTIQKEAAFYKFQIAYDTYYNIGDKKWLSATEINRTIMMSVLKGYGLFELDNLYPFTKYVLRVATVNNYTTSPYSVERRFITRIRVGQEDTSLCSKAIVSHRTSIASILTAIFYFIIARSFFVTIHEY